MTTIAPVNQRGNASAVFVADFDGDGPIPAGHFHFFSVYGDPEKSKAGILFGCPCGCGQLKAVGFDTHWMDGPLWHFDGDRDRPTLTPSILIFQLNEQGAKVGEHWHGFLTDGEFRSC